MTALVAWIRRTAPLRRAVSRLAAPRARDVADRIQPLLRPGDRVVDIGSGTCQICEILQGRGFAVTPVDVADLSFVDSIAPRVYDGHTLPFAAGDFDVGLLITVLHHTPDPDRIVREAARVCRRLIVVEDVHRGTAHKYFTFAMDSLVNLEFVGHPHTNRSDGEWRATFARLGLRVVHSAYQRSLGVFRHATYQLERD